MNFMHVDATRSAQPQNDGTFSDKTPQGTKQEKRFSVILQPSESSQVGIHSQGLEDVDLMSSSESAPNSEFQMAGQKKATNTNDYDDFKL